MASWTRTEGSVASASARTHDNDDGDMFQTMSIASSARPTLHEEKPYFRTHNLAYTTADIEGASPRMRHKALKKPDLYRNDDIEGSHPKPQFGSRSEGKNETILRVDDIEGAKAKIEMFRTNRCVNPLDPTYALPEVEHKRPTPPPFKYSGFCCDDIDGAKAQSHYAKPIYRDPLNVDDIEGTKRKERKPSQRSSGLDVRDINSQGIWKTQRVSDPLNPTHEINGMKVTDGSGSKPLQHHRKRRGEEPDFSLTTLDIEGAQADTVQKYDTTDDETLGRSKEYRNINYVGDIPGASPGTLRKGPKSQRDTDPNRRNYVFLDGTTDENQLSRKPEAEYSAYERYARKLEDPRDREIEDLRRQLEELKNEKHISSLQGQLENLKQTNAIKQGLTTSDDKKSTSSTQELGNQQRSARSRQSSKSSGRESRGSPKSYTEESKHDAVPTPRSSPPRSQRLVEGGEKLVTSRSSVDGNGDDSKSDMLVTRTSKKKGLPPRIKSLGSTTLIAKEKTRQTRDLERKRKEVDEVQALQ